MNKNKKRVGFDDERLGLARDDRALAEIKFPPFRAFPEENYSRQSTALKCQISGECQELPFDGNPSKTRLSCSSHRDLPLGGKIPFQI